MTDPIMSGLTHRDFLPVYHILGFLRGTEESKVQSIYMEQVLVDFLETKDP